MIALARNAGQSQTAENFHNPSDLDSIRDRSRAHGRYRKLRHAFLSGLTECLSNRIRVDFLTRGGQPFWVEVGNLLGTADTRIYRCPDEWSPGAKWLVRVRINDFLDAPISEAAQRRLGLTSYPKRSGRGMTAVVRPTELLGLALPIANWICNPDAADLPAWSPAAVEADDAYYRNENKVTSSPRLSPHDKLAPSTPAYIASAPCSNFAVVPRVPGQALCAACDQPLRGRPTTIAKWFTWGLAMRSLEDHDVVHTDCRYMRKPNAAAMARRLRRLRTDGGCP